MRLFIAIELPEDTRCKLLALKRDIPGVRWVLPEQLHLTLLFLGEIEDNKLGQLILALSKIKVVPFTLNFSKTGCFPHSHAPKVLWVGLDHQPALNALAATVRAVVLSCAVPLERRPFSPHITLARVKQPGSFDISCYLTQDIREKFTPLHVREFVLFSSTLTPQGAIHRPIKVFPCQIQQLKRSSQ